jgi:hypothetical protein
MSCVSDHECHSAFVPGVSVFQLAANMGTSVEMLDDFYGKKRVRDPKYDDGADKIVIEAACIQQPFGGFNGHQTS